MGPLAQFFKRRDAAASAKYLGRLNDLFAQKSDAEMGMPLYFGLATMFAVVGNETEKSAIVMAALEDKARIETKLDRRTLFIITAYLKAEYNEGRKEPGKLAQQKIAGIDVAVHTLKVLEHRETLLAGGRQMWQHLLRGRGELPQIAAKYLQRELVEQNGFLAQFVHFPALLAPGIETDGLIEEIRALFEGGTEPISN